MRSEHDIWQNRMELLQAKKEEIEKVIDYLTKESVNAGLQPPPENLADAFRERQVQCPHCGKHFYI